MDDISVLLVDDEPDLLLNLEAAVRAEGYRVLTATNGQQAVDMARAHRPHLVLLDVMMPGMDGFEACRMIKDDPDTRDAFVIFLSAKDVTQSKVVGLDSGAFDYITKPFHYDELFARLRSFRREFEYRKKLNEMMEFSRSLNVLDFDALMTTIEKKIGFIFKSDFFSIFLWDHDKGQLKLIADNHDDFVDLKGLEIPLEKTPLMEEVIRTCHPVYVSDFHSSKYRTEERKGSSDKYRDPYALGIPLVMGDRIMGVLNLNGNSKGFFDLPDLTYLQLGAEHLTSAISNALQYQRIMEMAVTDPLTGLYNRRYFYERMGMEWDRAMRYKTKMSVMMTDVDFFKKVNDTFGHVCGDMILVQTALMLRKHLRKIDVIARYGGEEFIVLLPETPKQNAAIVADRIRQDMESSSWDWDGKQVRVTLSLGVEDTHGDGVKVMDDIIRIVDEKLYQAKESGRNKVVA
ncbi:MAG: diguanylate cyclase [Nitrospinae bacterium]|nr:diguanylate cyclase [Nitrospinota bacterium]